MFNFSYSTVRGWGKNKHERETHMQSPLFYFICLGHKLLSQLSLGLYSYSTYCPRLKNPHTSPSNLLKPPFSVPPYGIFNIRKNFWAQSFSFKDNTLNGKVAGVVYSHLTVITRSLQSVYLHETCNFCEIVISFHRVLKFAVYVIARCSYITI